MRILIALLLSLPLTLVAQNYMRVWGDEFNAAQLDTDAWNVEVNGDGGGNAELQYYTADNVSIDIEPTTGASCLVLTARRQQYGGRQFTSGRINTADKVLFTHGKIESRILMPPTANGLWPAFWMLGDDYASVGWPRCGEIDIVEMGNAEGISHGTQDRLFNGACHWGYYNAQAQYPNYARATTNPYSLQDGQFHLYTLVWDDRSIRMYLDLDRNPDAAPYYEMGITDMNGEWATGRYFHHDFFIVYDLAIGGYFTGILSPTAITALDTGEKKMYIDYVRVYQPADEVNIIYPDSYSDAIDELRADVQLPADGETRYYAIDGQLQASNTLPTRPGIYVCRRGMHAEKCYIR